MKYFVRLIVFVMSILITGALFAAVALSPGANTEKFAAFAFCVGAFVGFMFSGRAMDAVAGKLPKDEQ